MWGVVVLCPSGLRIKSAMTVDCVVVPTLWIPAYAGMTVGSGVGFTLEDFFNQKVFAGSGRLSAMMRLRVPTWLAANPTPSASMSVSTMSVASLQTSSSMRLIVLHFRRRMGSGYMRIFRIDMMLDVTRVIKEIL